MTMIYFPSQVTACTWLVLKHTRNREQSLNNKVMQDRTEYKRLRHIAVSCSSKEWKLNKYNLYIIFIVRMILLMLKT